MRYFCVKCKEEIPWIHGPPIWRTKHKKKLPFCSTCLGDNARKIWPKPNPKPKKQYIALCQQFLSYKPGKNGMRWPYFAEIRKLPRKDWNISFKKINMKKLYKLAWNYKKQKHEKGSAIYGKKGYCFALKAYEYERGYKAGGKGGMTIIFKFYLKDTQRELRRRLRKPKRRFRYH